MNIFTDLKDLVLNQTLLPVGPHVSSQLPSETILRAISSSSLFPVHYANHGNNSNKNKRDQSYKTFLSKPLVPLIMANLKLGFVVKYGFALSSIGIWWNTFVVHNVLVHLILKSQSNIFYWFSVPSVDDKRIFSVGPCSSNNNGFATLVRKKLN